MLWANNTFMLQVIPQMIVTVKFMCKLLNVNHSRCMFLLAGKLCYEIAIDCKGYHGLLLISRSCWDIQIL